MIRRTAGPFPYRSAVEPSAPVLFKCPFKEGLDIVDVPFHGMPVMTPPTAGFGEFLAEFGGMS